MLLQEGSVWATFYLISYYRLVTSSFPQFFLSSRPLFEILEQFFLKVEMVVHVSVLISPSSAK